MMASYEWKARTFDRDGRLKNHKSWGGGRRVNMKHCRCDFGRQWRQMMNGKQKANRSQASTTHRRRVVIENDDSDEEDSDDEDSDNEDDIEDSEPDVPLRFGAPKRRQPLEDEEDKIEDASQERAVRVARRRARSEASAPPVVEQASVDEIEDSSL